VKFTDSNLADKSQTAGLPPLGGTIVPPRGIGAARLQIGTTDLAPADGTPRKYRIYAIVDPDNEIRWKRADGSLAEQTHLWHRPQLTIRLKSAPPANVTVKLELQDKDRKVLESVSQTSDGSGAAAMTQWLLSKLKDSATIKSNNLQVALDPATSNIVVSHAQQKTKPSTERRSGIFIDANKAFYFVPSVSGDPSVTVTNTVLVTNDAPAQNKEGYFDLTVMAPVAPTAERPVMLSLPQLAVAAIDAAGKLAEKNVTLPSGQKASLRVTVNATEAVATAIPIALYLGDPTNGGTFLGMLSASGIAAGTPAHTWSVLPMPNAAGDFPMYARIGSGEAKAAGLMVHLTP
jgi:hypothetical protein